MSDALQPAVCFGAVMHERHVQAHNRFVYPSAFLRLPLARLDTLRVPLLGIEAPMPEAPAPGTSMPGAPTPVPGDVPPAPPAPSAPAAPAPAPAN